MSQRISFGGLSGSGIVVILFIIGIVLYLLDILKTLGVFVIVTAIIIGVLYALLGAAGILRRF